MTEGIKVENRTERILEVYYTDRRFNTNLTEMFPGTAQFRNARMLTIHTTDGSAIVQLEGRDVIIADSYGNIDVDVTKDNSIIITLSGE